ncbi:helix-turn-helix domain-containing protein [Halomonas cupida]|uniref:Predicted DNA-binding protein, contains XRE-type HTH domain n=1 Tax=Halomonas cupida TaxID=44933 RepID=A0A1M7MK87_9GAMM|nr:XRE family transcriptional regulator [Halomonas cupida]GEN26338.1 transcriptional regulator [Halomonas cupida]SHM91267.1 Predicted DNA-binding protein, contains XRE-type HTH domain [Halomonas cupida]
MARFESVWDAISDTPQEALNMKVRAELMSKLTDTIEAWDITQREAAERLGVTQPRVNDLLKGRIDRFSVDTLLNMSAAAHIPVTLSFATEVA